VTRTYILLLGNKYSRFVLLYSDATTLQTMSYKNKHGTLINLAKKLTTFREAFPKRSALSGTQTGAAVNTPAFSWQTPVPGELDFAPAFSRWT
jgi:hypothetical protein